MATESNTLEEHTMPNQGLIESDQRVPLSKPEDSSIVTPTSHAVDAAEAPSLQYLGGWRLNLLALGLSLSIFLSALDITIVSTSLVSITNDLQAFEDSSWIVTSYLVSYSGEKTCLVPLIAHAYTLRFLDYLGKIGRYF